MKRWWKVKIDNNIREYFEYIGVDSMFIEYLMDDDKNSGSIVKNRNNNCGYIIINTDSDKINHVHCGVSDWNFNYGCHEISYIDKNDKDYHHFKDYKFCGVVNISSIRKLKLLKINESR